MILRDLTYGFFLVLVLLDFLAKNILSIPLNFLVYYHVPENYWEDYWEHRVLAERLK
jgi:hypothetical protein